LPFAEAEVLLETVSSCASAGRTQRDAEMIVRASSVFFMRKLLRITNASPGWGKPDDDPRNPGAGALNRAKPEARRYVLIKN
jgi:hypothetical protein